MLTNLRSYHESFEPEKIQVISGLIDDLVMLGEPPTGYRLYALEIRSCLSVGLLLAALSVSTSLLDLFVRDLVVAVRLQSKHDGDMRFWSEVEREAEEDKSLRFDGMLEELRLTVILPDDVELLSQFYAKTRIPLAHGLVRRLTSQGMMPEFWENMFPDSTRGTGLEDHLEDTALSDVSFVLVMMKKYRPWLVRRYSL